MAIVISCNPEIGIINESVIVLVVIIMLVVVYISNPWWYQLLS